MSPYYEDDLVTLYLGDCLDVLRELPDASVDAVVTDPPYGLANTDPAHVAETITRWVNGERDYLPGGAGFMGKAWDAFVPPVAVWDDCLRVLKPGGHVLAFAGSRTVDLMTLGLRLAGFDIRDSIAWLYGSGFPKSLDVSKAIDRGSGENRARQLEFTAWMRSTGITAAQINDATGSFMGSHYLTDKAQAAIATAEMFELIRPLLPEAPERIERLVAERTGIEWTDYINRPVIRQVKRTGKESGTYGAFAGDNTETTAATPESAHWQGWGTALKPSHEPVCVAVKPYAVGDILAGIGSQLARLESECKRPVNDAARSSAPTPHGSSEARIDSAPAHVATQHGAGHARTTPTGAAAGSSGATDTSASESTGATCWNTVTSWRACWAELCDLTNTFTTSTTIEATTDLRTLWSSISSLTVTSTPDSPTPALTSGSTASAVDSLFAATVLRLRATLALSAAEPATASTPRGSLDAGGSSPAFEPIVVARKPLAGTVAANVLAHGTGALNIAACRIGDEVRQAAFTSLAPAHGNRLGAPGTAEARRGTQGDPKEYVGRWPANVVLDESQATALDEQSGESVSKRSAGRNGQNVQGVTGIMAPRADDQERGHDALGGASRFFYVAKADASERVRVDGVAHPTVKPLALMRWLVRLVTPPGGVVLEPFGGSGTTVEACILEGFRCIAIEREDDYLPLIVQRINRRRDPVAAVKGAGEDGGLFDLLDDGGDAA